MQEETTDPGEGRRYRCMHNERPKEGPLSRDVLWGRAGGRTADADPWDEKKKRHKSF